jgi:hypothetical protein
MGTIGSKVIAVILILINVFIALFSEAWRLGHWADSICGGVSYLFSNTLVSFIIFK